MDEISGWLTGFVYSATCSCFDLVGQCCRVMLLGRPMNQLACDLFLAYLYLPGSRKYYLWKKNDWLKNKPFFITENFLGILDRLCAEPMHRSHDFLSLTLAVVASTSGSCYFLLQCRCLWVCVLCVLVVRCVKC